MGGMKLSREGVVVMGNYIRTRRIATTHELVTKGLNSGPLLILLRFLFYFYLVCMGFSFVKYLNINYHQIKATTSHYSSILLLGSWIGSWIGVVSAFNQTLKCNHH